MKIKIVVAVLLCMNALSMRAAAQGGESMDLVPSVWAAWMRGSMNVDGQQAKVVRKGDDYFENLDYGYSLELSLRNSQMVLLGFVDYFDPLTSEVTVDGAPGTLESSEIIGGLAVGYPMGSGTSTLDVLFGFQTLRLDNDLYITGGASYSDSSDIYDAVVMVRIKQQLFSNLYVHIPLSMGGTYLSDSQFVYDAGIQLLYKFGKTIDLRAGYRITGFDFSDDADATDFYQQGYTAGVGITF